MQKKLISAAAAAVIWAGSAHAVTTDGYDIPYVGAAYLYEFSDRARDSDNGQGFSVNLGWPLTAHGYENWAAELTFHAIERDREIDGNPDYQRGLLLDLVYDFGAFGWGADASSGFGFKPFALVGLGAVQNDVRGDEHEHFGLNVGGGALIPLNWHGVAVRAEGRVLGQVDDKSVAGEDILVDYRVSVGLQVPLTAFFSVGDRADAGAAPACGLAVVDPVTGRADCGSDLDRDGVLDSLDQCPATPAGTAVDARGCTLNLTDDSDGDGVTNALDLCPGTPAGVKVDEKGCVVGQTLVLRGVNFENDQAVLDLAARAILDDVSTSMKNQANVSVEIGGHTDSNGSETYNQMLSQERAESVRQYLIAHGVEAARLSATGYGETRPVASNDTAAGRAENRRVEFKLLVAN